MTQATGPWGGILYSYDPVGNRITETAGSSVTNYTYSANRLMMATGGKTFSFSYDNNGNAVTKDQRQYVYNQNQRLIKALDNATVLGQYVYDGKGQRVKKTVNGQTTLYHYDLEGHLIAESTASGAITTTYVYLQGQPVAKIEGNALYFYHNDHLGTPMMVTDQNRTIVWQAEQLPFGKPQSITGAITNNLRFPGQYYDAETGLHYNHFRDYMPEIGRYMEKDPIGLKGGINLYEYAYNNPVRFIDPIGLYSWADVPKAWDHYCDGSGTPWSTSFGSINWGDTRSRINTAIRSMMGGSCRNATIPVNMDVEGQTAGADAAIIGRHTIRVSGQIKLNCDCSWTFTGSMASALGYDPYNFNASNRGPLGEASTWLGRTRCHNTGRTFNIIITGSESLSLSGRL